jgi:hypothetical protein
MSKVMPRATWPARMPKLAPVGELAVQIAATLLALLFAISSVLYLCLGYSPVTHQDYWRIYEFALNHTWLESALHKHAEHLIFFPSFFWLADLRFFHGKQLPLFWMGFTMLFLTIGLLLVPVWRDKTVNLTAKIMATLAIIVGNFWMARSPIIASAGFNCICSLLMMSAALAFVLLPSMGTDSSRRFWAISLLVVSAGFVASFSFGTGLAIWPSLLFLAWCLRLHWRCLVSIGIAAVAAVVIYQQVPPHVAGYKTIEGAGALGLALVGRLCRIAGGPFFYASSGWHEKQLSLEAAKSSILSLSCGGAGVVLAVVAMTFTMIRRDLSKSSLKLIGMALVTFNFVVMALIVTGNSLRGSRFQFEFLLPRYLFWSALFWTGLLLVGIQLAVSIQWLRWPVYLVALALPVMVSPMHYKSGVHCRLARIFAEEGAISLLNEVRDDQQVAILAPAAGGINQVYRLAEQLRARRLDMFADGLQDWFGLSERQVTRGRYKRQRLTGRCGVAALLQCNNGAPAARVTGRLWKRRHQVPHTLIVVDQMGLIRGIGHSFARFSENRFVDKVFYLNKTPTSVFFGYIRDFDPQQNYAVRSADNGVLSEEAVPVKIPKSMNQ